MYYKYSDIKDAFNFAKNNPDKNVEDWIDHKSKFLTQEELDLYKGVRYCKFLMNDVHEVYLFSSNSNEDLDGLVTMFIGNREAYAFYQGDNYGLSYTLITFDKDLFDSSKWADVEGLTGLKFIKNEKLKIEFQFENFPNDVDELVSERFGRYQNTLQRDRYYFWNNTYSFYFMSLEDLDFEIAIDLFKLDKQEK